MNTEEKLLTKLFVLLLPIAFASYLFHELGHWVIGEALGNDMVYSLNSVSPRNGHYIDQSHGLYVLIGEPAFTILLSLLFLLIIEKSKTIYAYLFVFFQMFMRFFSLVFRGFSKQDEAKISSLLDIGTYTAAIVVLLILFILALISSKKLHIKFTTNNYFFVMSTLSQVLVIATDKYMVQPCLYKGIGQYYLCRIP